MTAREQKAYDEALRLIEEYPQKAVQVETLRLDSLGLTVLPPEIGKLTALTRLDLYGNQLSTLPPEIGQLTKLDTLYLGINQLSALPPEIGKLTALEWLDLSENQLSTLPPEIGQLTALKELVLWGNQLSTLPPEIVKLTALEKLFLHGNSGLALPGEVLGPSEDDVDNSNVAPASPRAILDYYFTRQAGGTKALNEVKIILVGWGEAGKTSVRKRLVQNRFDEAEKETQGIQIQDWELERRKDGITAHIWDFAGQEITHATHQFFLTHRSLYLLVLDGRSDSQDRDAEYWLRMIRSFGGDSPVIVLLNKWDLKPFAVNEFTLRRDFPQIRAFLPTDCRTGLGISELGRLILETARGMKSVTVKFPRLWFDVKERMAGMKEHYLPLCEFRRICEEHKISEKGQQNSLAEILHHLGIILHYADDERLHDTTVLNPRWVTESVYRLIRAVEERQFQTERFDGKLTLEEARKALPEEKVQLDAEGRPIDMVRYVIGLMERFEICYALEGSDDTWLIPQQLSRQAPKALGQEWFTQPATRLRYQYDLLQKGLLPRFIVRVHPLVYENIVWRDGVIVEMQDIESSGTARALVMAEATRQRIEVSVIGSAAARLRLTKLIRAHFRDIHAKYGVADAQEYMELESQPGSYQKIITLVKDEKNHAISTVPTDQGSIRIDQTQELNRVAAPEGKERQENARATLAPRPKVFLSYAHKDAAHRDVFLQNLEVMEMDGLIDSWHDGKILPSQEFDQEIRSQLEVADIIIFLISTESLRSTYIRKVEMARALERLKEAPIKWRSPLVIPIVLGQNCGWKDSPLAHLQMLPADRSNNLKAVDQWPSRRQAFDAVEQQLRRLLKES